MLARGRPKKRDSITHDLLVPSIGGTGELEFLGFLIATIWTLQLIRRGGLVEVGAGQLLGSKDKS